MANNEFLENIKDIETSLFNSETFKYLQKSQLGNAEISGVIAEIYKQAVSGALNLEELKLKAQIEAFNVEKAKMELELGKENLKAQIKQAQSEALKSLIQAKSMVRSVVDNAAIQRANAYVGLGNVVGNAAEQAALTNAQLVASETGQTTGTGIAQLTCLNIEKISIDPFNEFDDLLKDMINDVNFIGKDIMIFAPKVVVEQGSELNLTGLTSYEGETSFLLDEGSLNENGELVGAVEVAKNSKNYIFVAEKIGEVKVIFQVQFSEIEQIEVEVEKENENGEIIKEMQIQQIDKIITKQDSITLKIVKNLGEKQIPAIKKY